MYGGFHDATLEGCVFTEAHQAGRVVIVRIGRRGYGARDGKVADGGAIRAVEGGSTLPGAHDVDGERVALAVERAGILMFFCAHQHEVFVEFEVGGQLGVDVGMAVRNHRAPPFHLGGCA